uniref:Uncharacterized protein n=1 Tax=Cyprinus carpio TaxID=7962 RepID=A0A8C1YE01_CYPCA
AEGPNGHEDEEEDENFYTEIRTDSEKISTSKSFGGPYDNCEDEESWTGCSGHKRKPYLVRFASKYSSCGRSGDVEPCTSTNLPSSCNASHKPPAVVVTEGLLLHSKYPSVSSHQKFGESRIENKDLKWDQFLTVVPNHQDEEEYDYEAHSSSHCDDNAAVPYFTKALTDMGLDSEEHRYPPNEKSDGGILERRRSVGDGNFFSPTNSHSSEPAGFDDAVCK